MDAARRLFGEAGDVTLNGIAQEAGVGIATLYRHFPNRQVLAKAVMERLFDEDVEPLLEEFASGDASRGELLQVAEAVLDLLDRERGVVESIGDPAEVATYFLDRDDRLAQMVERARTSGNLRADIDAGDLPVLLATLATGAGVLHVVDPDARRRYLSLLLDGLNPSRAVPLPERQAPTLRTGGDDTKPGLR